jgi:DNA-binding MarR family transcriptional regulator
VSRQVLTTQVSSPALDAWVRLLRSSVAATRALSADLQSEHGLTINDYEALLLADENALKRIELAEGLLLTPSGVTRLLDGLELAGWVKKGTCQSDARVTYAILTDAGREKLEQAGRSHVAAVRALFEAHLDNEELGTLAELLGRLPGAAGADAADCAA